jgi:hypothetical protein
MGANPELFVRGEVIFPASVLAKISGNQRLLRCLNLLCALSTLSISHVAISPLSGVRASQGKTANERLCPLIRNYACAVKRFFSAFVSAKIAEISGYSGVFEPTKAKPLMSADGR